jgi:CysZ protein
MGHALDSAWRALGDLFGPTLRGLILACVGLAAAILAGLVWAAMTFLIPMISLPWPWAATGLEWLASAGAIVLALVLIPAVSMVVAGALLDVAAERMEKRAFPTDPPGRPLAPQEGLAAGLKIASVSLPLNLIALPLQFIPVVGLLAFLALNAFLAGREFFSVASLRFRGWEESAALRKRYWGPVFLAGLLIAAWMLIPILNLTTPLFAIALMTRLQKRLAPASTPTT